MPASEIMSKFKAGDLHSGSSNGKIVKNPKQAKAILLSYLRKEGKPIEPPEGMAEQMNGMKSKGILKTKKKS
jgi:hypothetical protein